MWDPYTSNTTPLQTQFVSIKAAKWPHAAHLGKGQKSFVGGSFLAADINDKANNKVSSNQGAGWSQITYSPHPRLPMKKEPNCQNEDKKFPFTVENKHCFNQCTNNPTFTSWWVFYVHASTPADQHTHSIFSNCTRWRKQHLILRLKTNSSAWILPPINTWLSKPGVTGVERSPCIVLGITQGCQHGRGKEEQEISLLPLVWQAILDRGGNIW